jgi:hypothetical protein
MPEGVTYRSAADPEFGARLSMESLTPGWNSPAWIRARVRAKAPVLGGHEPGRRRVEH